MPQTKADPKAEITLDLLSAVESERTHSQRTLARELGVALGLTNAYVKRCIKRGWIKATQAPPNRYGYYLTPKGFSEKSKLTARYLRSSFSFYRRARNELDELFEECIRSGEEKIALAGRSEVAEIALLCASQHPVDVVAVLDSSNEPSFLGTPVAANLESIDRVDAVIVTDILSGQKTYDRLCSAHTDLRIHAPKLLRITKAKP